MEKKAIIVGASSGIGREVARLLLADGWRVGVSARREERLHELQSEAPNRVEVMAIDVTQPDADECLLRFIEHLGGIDLYFHAAGIGWQNRTLERDKELRTLTTNGLGFARLVGAAFRYFADRAARGDVPAHGKEFVLAAITSIAGTKGLGPAPAYSATKAFQATYLEALEQQARQRGLAIRIADFRPGFVDTALLKPEGEDSSASAPFRYPMLMRPQAVAGDIVASLRKHRRVRVIDLRYRLLTFFWRLIPRWLWRRIRL